MGLDLPDTGASRLGLYRFDDIEVDAVAHTLKRGGEPRAVEPKAFAVLLALLQRPGALIGRDELLDAVWGHRHVTPGVLTRAIAQLRNALGDDPQHPRYILTRHALGYSFVGDLGERSRAGNNGAGSGVVASDSKMSSSIAALDEANLTSSNASRFPSRASSLAAAALLAAVLAAVGWHYMAREQRRPLPTGNTIAVLPFATLSNEVQDRYYAEGLATELLGALSGLNGLKVAAWRPPAAVDRSLGIKELGAQLGVATILDANVRREDGRLRINAMLSDVNSGYVLWSKSYDGAIADVFDIQLDIARHVSRIMTGSPPNPENGLKKRLFPTTDVSAFEDYLQGLASVQGSADATDEATRHFRQALSKDSGFARAQAQLCRLESWSFETHRNPDAFQNALMACRKAEKMEPALGEVDLALGDLFRVKGDHENAMRYYEKLLLVPEFRVRGLIGRAQVLVDQGHEDEAIEQFRLAEAQAPPDAQLYAELGYQQYRMGKYQDAIKSYRRVVDLRPDRAAYWSIYGALLLHIGKNDAAMAALKRSIDIEPNANSLANMGEVEYQAGNYSAAAELYRQAMGLNPGKFAYVGYLADALSADASSRNLAGEAYALAAERAKKFITLKKNDAMAYACLGWYLANLGEKEEAIVMLESSERIKNEVGEVAFVNARTLALLGDKEQARERIDVARRYGVSASRISSDATLVRVGLASQEVAFGN
ncbi:MAG: tetratricopeptide repeat protein [Proteobacteria bacterium]|nr:tetratricopeptide repeat protein [Pseudomonadota bacterium]